MVINIRLSTLTLTGVVYELWILQGVAGNLRKFSELAEFNFSDKRVNSQEMIIFGTRSSLKIIEYSLKTILLFVRTEIESIVIILQVYDRIFQSVPLDP